MKKMIISALMVFGLAEVSYAAVSANTSSRTSAAAKSKIDPVAYQNLTGKKLSNNQVAVKASAEKALQLARESRNEGDHILAIKRYNFIMKYYPKSAQAKMALSDKADIYNKLGLRAPAEFNRRKAGLLDQATAQRISNAQSKPGKLNSKRVNSVKK